MVIGQTTVLFLLHRETFVGRLIVRLSLKNKMASASEIIARRLLKQAKWCAKLRSPLYAKLLYEAATDVRGLGICRMAFAWPSR
jgi:hypothetical protein